MASPGTGGGAVPPPKSPQPTRSPMSKSPRGDTELHRMTIEQLAVHPQLAGLRQRVAQKSANVNKNIVKAGWMLKRKGKAGISGWKKRFIVIDVDTVTYYKGPGDERLGSWELLLCVGRDGGKHVLVDTPEGSYQLQPEDGSVPEWLAALHSARAALFGVDSTIGPAASAAAGSAALGGAAARSHTTLGASYVPAAIEADDNTARVAAFNELVATEEVYVHNLGVVVKQWMPPLMEAAGNEAAAVFGNVQLLESVNGQLLARLLKPESRRNVGEAFLQLVPFFKMYKDYCANQESARSRLEQMRKSKVVAGALERAQQRAGSGMPLESYLIMPMQRICRYPLVLQEIYKSTPDHWPDKVKLKSAIEAVSATTKEVNEVKRETESQQRILDLQTELMRHNKEIGGNLLAAGRRLICDDKPVRRASVFGEDLDEDVVIFLLSDVLLVCTRDKKKRLLLLHRVELSGGCEVQELPYGLEQPNGFAIKHTERGRVELTFEPEHPADDWRKALTESLASLRDLQSRQGRPVSVSPATLRKATLAQSSRRVSTPSLTTPIPTTSPPTANTASPGLQRVKTASGLDRRVASLNGGGWRRGTVGSVNDLATRPAKAKIPTVAAAAAAAVLSDEDVEEDESEDEGLEDSPMVFRKKPSPRPHSGPLHPPKAASAPAPVPAATVAPAAASGGGDDKDDEGEVVHW